jgi:WXXGXW repeat (2 copies)
MQFDAAEIRMKRNRLLPATVFLAGFLSIGAARVDLGLVVGAPPPPPPPGVVVAPVGVAPGPGYVWVPGYWDWVDGRWVWVDGRWVLPPRPHGVWVEPKVEFRLHRGHWR